MLNLRGVITHWTWNCHFNHQKLVRRNSLGQILATNPITWRSGTSPSSKVRSTTLGDLSIDFFRWTHSTKDLNKHVGSMGLTYLPTWMADFYGFHVGTLISAIVIWILLAETNSTVKCFLGFIPQSQNWFSGALVNYEMYFLLIPDSILDYLARINTLPAWN